MNNHEAKKILSFFRPGSADENDPSFNEARQLARTDAEVGHWFETHCESYRILRQKFQSIPVPPALKEQILSERKINRTLFQRSWRPLLAAAAAVALLVGVGLELSHRHSVNIRYGAYRQKMVDTAVGVYFMDFMATDQGQIRAYLKGKSAPDDYDLPAGLKAASVVGCAVPSWQGRQVSLVCFKTGRPLPQGDLTDLWLFVADRKDVSDPPPAGAPQFAQINKATTASWSEGNKVYLLASVGDQAFLQKYLQ